ncbi:voltage-gated hydrogen channel 1 [Elysia marginata]|uniref:Voltage-gated hydrogen channel 1 n=1 Tax=Elysia marginata TaxID=1093978 RepID=A0AAV4IZU9_9GAST|nr:voltage-gated hydrogen channel 1 [Elysia marginata]
MPHYKIQDFVFILAFLLPWRVIRVVNSLVVAVQDHEHFRLKLIYGRKKKIVNSLRETEIKLQLFRAQCNALKRLCYNEGVEESKIDQILMVEECVVNKAGKSKCKIKIDNSSVILLNDKSDFPRLSPRPSLLNLVDKVSARRKSMQPQCLASADRDLFLACKDNSRKGFFKARARSNSESGRGTLSSPDDCGASGGILGAMGQYNHQNSLGEGGSAYSGLNTPIVIDRKASLSSPMMAGHVKHILHSLDAKINQMNGSGGRLVGPRNSVDADSIAEEGSTVDRKRGSSLEDVDDGGSTKSGGSSVGGGNRRNSSGWHQRRVDSIEEAVETSSPDAKFTTTKAEQSVALGLRNKRRASLQPQRCVDEDDADILSARRTFTLPESEFIDPYSQNHNSLHHNGVSNASRVSVQGRAGYMDRTGPWSQINLGQEKARRPSVETSSSTSQVMVMPQTDSHYFTPTTIHVDPPSTTSNYSLSSSNGSAGANNLRGISPIAEQSINGSSQSVSGLYDASETEKSTQEQNSTIYKAPLASCDADDEDYDLVDNSECSATQEPSRPSTKLEGMSVSDNSLDDKISLSSETAKKTLKSETDVTCINNKNTSTGAADQGCAEDKTSRPIGASLKPKTLRTPSDIENQNNLTISEHGSRTSSIEETSANVGPETKLNLGDFSEINETNTVAAVVVGSRNEKPCGSKLLPHCRQSPSLTACSNGSNNLGSAPCASNISTSNSRPHAHGTTIAKEV